MQRALDAARHSLPNERRTGACRLLRESLERDEAQMKEQSTRGRVVTSARDVCALA
jgi:hypothetical protein